MRALRLAVPTAVRLAVGAYQNTSGELVPMAVTGEGSQWQRAVSTGIPSPAAKGSLQNAALIAVSCDAAEIYCTAVGDYADTGGIDEAMAASGGM